jgi:hypothetical protein
LYVLLLRSFLIIRSNAFLNEYYKIKKLHGENEFVVVLLKQFLLLLFEIPQVYLNRPLIYLWHDILNKILIKCRYHVSKRHANSRHALLIYSY